MTWVRLADDFADHPKIVEAGSLAGWLWVCGIAYANKHLTDGYLPAAAVRRLADVEDPFRLAARLVAVGLWEAADGGYRIHDFSDYQPSAEAVRAERKRNAERAATWRERQREAGSTGARASDRNGVSADAPASNPGPGLLSPGPAGTSPLPPPHAEGEGRRTNQRGRRRQEGGSFAPPAPVEVPPLAPLSDADRDLWNLARDTLTEGWLPSNAEKAAAFVALGRDDAGALWLRAPPWASAAVSQQQVRAALVAAGDAAGGQAHIVVGSG